MCRLLLRTDMGFWYVPFYVIYESLSRLYTRYFWQGNHQMYGHIRCIYTVLANPKYRPRTKAFVPFS